MRVKTAKTAGFCFGVRRAVNLTIDACHNKPGPTFTYGPLIHNPQVVGMLEELGVSVTGDDLPPRGTVVTRSHGVSPEVKSAIRDGGLNLLDATCPRVARIHGIVSKCRKKGYAIVVLGDEGHAEVNGIVAWAGGEAMVVSGPGEVEKLPEADKVCFVAQTTQERERFRATERALRARFPGLGDGALIIKDTICDSTRNRQDEVRRLAGEVDAMVIVGGKGSANTARLAEVARDAGVPAFLAETEDDLDPGALRGFKTVGLTAGASTPYWMIRRVYDALREIEPERTLRARILDIIRFLLVSNVYTAMGAGALTVTAARVQGFWPRPGEVLVSMLFVFAIHGAFLLSNPKALALNVPARHRSYTRHRDTWLAILALSALASVGLSLWMGVFPGLALAALTAVSVLFSMRFISRDKAAKDKRSLLEIPAGKDFYMAFGWAALVVVLPLMVDQERSSGPLAALAALWLVTGLVFVRAIFRDFRDIQADRLIGRETLPIVLGVANTRKVLYASLLIVAIPFPIGTLAGWVPSPLGYLLLLPVAFAAASVPLFTRRPVIQGFAAEAVIDATFMLAGLIVVVSSLF